MYPQTEQEALEVLKGEDSELAATAEAILWRIWCRSGDPEADRLFRAGVEALQQRKLEEAAEIFGRLIGLKPEFAEGWNKRATVRYLLQDCTGSIADCQQTLARNPHHFGAASGQGLCHLSLHQFREAAVCFRRALEIHPHLEAVRHNLALAEAEGGGSGYLN
ncbi:MAG TPA: tetratricopeptide repeat protein [Terriglobales bacterium]|jgi:tetratricopeptide (TPR) repeat protein|nr:tetratricopeptide repeat protein [Terriglobales bacterium]